MELNELNEKVNKINTELIDYLTEEINKTNNKIIVDDGENDRPSCYKWDDDYSRYVEMYVQAIALFDGRLCLLTYSIDDDYYCDTDNEEELVECDGWEYIDNGQFLVTQTLISLCETW